ncbi:MAG: hypothetical protein MRY64_15680 [Hyphomonadaceae bacterium]|nr:hypothetical protein [Hyphomonadaceae bacterium]
MSRPGDYSGVLRAAGRVGAPTGGRAILFVTPDDEALVREAATGFARMVAGRSEKPVWLLDLDFRGNSVFHHLDAMATKDAERPGRAFSAALDAAPLYKPVGRRLIATLGNVNPAKLLSLHELPGQNLFVSRFRAEAIVEGQKLALNRSPAWWQAAKGKAGWISVHALPLSQGGAALSFCRDVDGVVLVVQADVTPLEDVAAMREEVEAAGGHVLGAVMLGLRGDARLFARVAA